MMDSIPKIVDRVFKVKDKAKTGKVMVCDCEKEFLKLFKKYNEDKKPTEE